jgi:uncharacterized protein YndB with AHSA1/START domain
MDTTQLARFVDRYTMVYERTYPHEIELVWEAVSTAEHLDVWMLPVTRVERHLGGRCSFTWGGPHKPEQVGEVTEYDPPRAIRYTFGDERSFLRFQLESVVAGTRLWFTHSFAPGTGTTPSEPSDAYGADLPAGPDAPWRPGFVAGFHSMLDQLDAYLGGAWTAADVEPALAAERRHGPDESQRRLIDRYREHIATACPEM